MAMKLIALLFEINDNFVRRFYELKKINIILDNGYYKDNYNTNILKIIQKLIRLEPEIGKKTVPDWIIKIKTQTMSILGTYLNSSQ